MPDGHYPGTPMPEGPIDPRGWQGDPPSSGSPRWGAVFLDQKFPGLPVDSSTLSWKADPAGGLTTIEQNGGGFVPAFKRGQLWVPLCTVFDTTTDPVTVNHFPTYSLNGSQRIEFETIDVSVHLEHFDKAIWVGDSVSFALSMDPKVVVDSIRWTYMYWPKKPLPAVPAPQCNNQRNCTFKPTTSGGYAFVRVYSFAGTLDAASVEMSVINRCPTDPPASSDKVLASPGARAALMELLERSWADSVAGKRKERQVFFYRDASDTSATPQVFVSWEGTDTKPPTPCMNWFQRLIPGPSFVLIGWGHSHPFASGEIQPSQCGLGYSGLPYTPGPSTPDWRSHSTLKVPGYAIDKQSVNKFQNTPYTNTPYDWNTATCRW